MLISNLSKEAMKLQQLNLKAKRVANMATEKPEKDQLRVEKTSVLNSLIQRTHSLGAMSPI